MTQSDYAALPWPEKKALIIRHLGQRAPRDIETLAAEQRARLPEELRDHPYGFLLWLWREHKAREVL
jgi:hypothetical protein